MRGKPETAGSEFDAPPDYRPSDRELGIGEEDAAVPAAAGETPDRDPGQAPAVPDAATGEPTLAELLARPEIAAAIDQLVAAKVAAQAAPASDAAAAAPTASDAAMERYVGLLVAALDKQATIHGQQMPGHVKPLAAEEVEARAAAFREMIDLIAAAERTGQRPEYLLTEDFYADEILWPKGQTVIWLGPPNVEMQPQNQVAARISERMWRWIGGAQVPIEDQVGDAYRRRPESAAGPAEPQLFRAPRTLTGSRVQAVPGTVRQQVGPRRVAGTVVPENPAGSISGPQRIMGPSLETEARPSVLQG